MEVNILNCHHQTIEEINKYTSIKDLGKSKRKIFKFIWEFYSKSSEIVCSFGEPMDFIGNRIDDEGRSIDKNGNRSEEHTSELQSRGHLVCRLLLEKKKHRCSSYSQT